MEEGTLGSPPSTARGGGSAQTSGHPGEDSRQEQPDVHTQNAGQQEHGQGQEQEHSPEAPAGRGPFSTEYRPGRGLCCPPLPYPLHLPGARVVACVQHLLCAGLWGPWGGGKAQDAPESSDTTPTWLPALSTAQKLGEAKRGTYSLGGRGQSEVKTGLGTLNPEQGTLRDGPD